MTNGEKRKDISVEAVMSINKRKLRLISKGRNDSQVRIEVSGPTYEITQHITLRRSVLLTALRDVKTSEPDDDR